MFAFDSTKVLTPANTFLFSIQKRQCWQQNCSNTRSSTRLIVDAHVRPIDRPIDRPIVRPIVNLSSSRWLSNIEHIALRQCSSIWMDVELLNLEYFSSCLQLVTLVHDNLLTYTQLAATWQAIYITSSTVCKWHDVHVNLWLPKLVRKPKSNLVG